MRSVIHRFFGWFIAFGVAAVICVVSLVAATPYAYAGHETRAIDVQESGVDLWIIGFTLGLVVLGLILFAAVMLAWERRDTAAARSGGSAAGRQPKP